MGDHPPRWGRRPSPPFGSSPVPVPGIACATGSAERAARRWIGVQDGRPTPRPQATSSVVEPRAWRTFGLLLALKMIDFADRQVLDRMEARRLARKLARVTVALGDGAAITGGAGSWQSVRGSVWTFMLVRSWGARSTTRHARSARSGWHRRPTRSSRGW